MAIAVSTTNLDTSINSLTIGVVIITIPNPAADVQYGTSVPCRTCWVSLNTGTHDFYVDGTTATTGTAYKIAAAWEKEIQIDDINKLHFIGTAGEKIQVLYRN